MEILIDGESGLISLAAGRSGEGLLARLEGALYSAGRVAVRYVYNGQDLNEEDLDSALGLKEPQGKLEISTISLTEHLQMILQSFAGAVKKSADQLVQLSEGLTQLDPTEALKQLGGWCADVSAMSSSLGQLLHMFNIQASEVGQGEVNMQASLATLESQCEELTLALRDNNRRALADLLECDIVKTLEQLQELFPALEEKVEEALAQ